ncbi:Asp-tRNA(Asn)/Glu-tRNA(Gln) amidotransferase subunit GatA [Reichenbachiella carrageenanivorans]|uniref:Glutamyl-tRNA(Gln) amidotransferase subunit A n=1 Tax=Reichenbachiella carrageenanivorans TaxID=2979869 RepID=A0ABY6D2V1_9BACT|nr:Asp-tRNA(Asn)/Glu-tRNA(Gln) amidotransferase subunit GatA [Reichenbachiella carrageenanivorans]UXX80481.1 Asp-tRNA(Asn)/Glu-tRNA(Gln) amidotransferase subunit GatA [Reichenbachiella carrageenanivorans]
MSTYDSLSRIQSDIDSGAIDCVGLVNHYISNIHKNKNLNALTAVYEAEALAAAKTIQAKIEAGTAGRLAGMVFTIKDVYCHEGHTLQCGSKILEGFESQFTATCVQRLLDEDAILIGRNNCDEFAMGSSNENSVFGPVINAAGENRVPGGSSGGSAVAVQADMCLVSIGSDTGGSVRQPAAYCGIVGLKPNYGRISRHGLSAYASSFDCVGILANTIEDTALTLEIMAGSDEYDTTVSHSDVPAYSKNIHWEGNAKIACFDNILSHEGLDEEVKSATSEAYAKLKNQGHGIDHLGFQYLDYVLPTYYILTTAEASTNLSRYDGVRYGYRSDKAHDLESMYKKSRSEGFGDEVKKRILLGTYVLSEGFYDAYFTKAQKVRRLIRDETKKIFETHDFIILPTAPTTAFELNSHNRDPLEMYLEDIFTVQASLAGLPAISLPNGKDKNGMPIGIQVIANTFEEEKLLSFSKYLVDHVLAK